MKTSGHIGSLLCSLPIAVLLSSCNIRLPVESASLPTNVIRTPVATKPAPKKPEVPIWLTANTYHTNMVFPYPWLIESGFNAPEGFGTPRYVVMSWGNTDAYSDAGIEGAGKLFRVLLTATPSVMELIPVNWHIEKVCPDHRIWQRQTPYESGPALASFLNQCINTQSDGQPIVVRPSSWGDGVQLESKYSYFIPRVCNVWSAQAIEAVGGDINPWYALTANGLIRQAEKAPNNFKQVWPAKPEIQ